MGFSFKGEISSSKSIFNRALIAQSFSDYVQIQGLSQSEDVMHLKRALKSFKSGGKELFCGDGGTTLRFLAMRVSREIGEFHITGSEQLFSRPIKPMLNFFDQVGVTYELSKNSLTLKGEGWNFSQPIKCDSAESSQFVSAMILSAWGLKQDLRIILPRQLPSLGYLQMTLRLMEELGAKCKVRGVTSFEDPSVHIEADQMPKTTMIKLEQDMSSLFALAACAILDGEIEITNISKESLQPDAIFFEYFRKMKIEYSLESKTFFIRRQDKYKGIDADFLNAPDLFPVLAVLACRSQGVSSFSGLHNLQYKESDRYKNTVELVKRLGRRVDVSQNGILISGLSVPFTGSGDFDPQGDHRMAMAAQVANFGGAKFKILNKSVVNKSFPEFWAILGEEDS